MTTSSSSGLAAPISGASATRVIAVVGPTAAGKTAVAEQIALQVGGEIVSADSMQVYRGMDIGTAKAAPEARAVPYHCLDLVEPGEPFSAALYQRAARSAIESVTAAGAVPIIAGGTGLYVRAALDPMDFPAGRQTGNAVRERYERFAATEGAEALYALLEARDPESAALIHRNNTRRVIRALELLEADVSYARHSKGFSARQSIYDSRFVGLTMERGELYARIDARVDAMMAAGLVSEVERLLEAGFRDALTARQAIGYKELVFVIERGANLDAAVADIKQATRRYAKRQLTWFRADPRVVWMDVTGLTTAEATSLVLEAID